MSLKITFKIIAPWTLPRGQWIDISKKGGKIKLLVWPVWVDWLKYFKGEFHCYFLLEAVDCKFGIRRQEGCQWCLHVYDLNVSQVIGVVFVSHLVVHLACVSINPADPNVRAKMAGGKTKVSSFDRSKHKHVIEDQHCYLCDVDVWVTRTIDRDHFVYAVLCTQPMRDNVTL